MLGNNDFWSVLPKCLWVLTQFSYLRPVQLLQGLDQLIVKNTIYIGQSLRKENFETVHIIKFHIIGTWCGDDPKTAQIMIELACEGIYYIGNQSTIYEI
jgi:hypothetical protein